MCIRDRLKNSNELLQDAISGEIGSLKDEVKENTVQEVRKALQANIEAIDVYKRQISSGYIRAYILPRI